MRLFVAVPLSDELKKKLTRFRQETWGNALDIAWSNPDQLHITLKFLGSVDEKRLPGLQEVLAFETQSISGFDLSIAGCGTFPAEGDPQTLWAGVREGVEPLRVLARRIQAAVEPFGFSSEDCPYVPHVTLGRLRTPPNMAILQAPLKRHKDNLFGYMHVMSFMLFNSRLSAAGSEYGVIEAFELQAASKKGEVHD